MAIADIRRRPLFGNRIFETYYCKIIVLQYVLNMGSSASTSASTASVVVTVTPPDNSIKPSGEMNKDLLSVNTGKTDELQFNKKKLTSIIVTVYGKI